MLATEAVLFHLISQLINSCMVTKKNNPPFGGRRGTVTFEVACVQQINYALSWQEKSGQLNEPTETRLNRRSTCCRVNCRSVRGASIRFGSPTRSARRRRLSWAITINPHSPLVWASVCKGLTVGFIDWDVGLSLPLSAAEKVFLLSAQGHSEGLFHQMRSKRANSQSRCFFFPIHIRTNLTVNVAVKLDWHAVFTVRTLGSLRRFIFPWRMLLKHEQ